MASDEHTWFVELGVENTRIPIGFYIPVEEKNIVVGHLQYGDVQSQKLFTWYQKFSHRWLKPEEAQNTKEE